MKIQSYMQIIATRDAVTDKTYSVFVKNLMHNEIAKAIPFEINAAIKKDFSDKVFERFCNPIIDHPLLAMQYTSKMKMQNVPLLLHYYYELFSTPPMHMATGFAAFLLFMKPVKKEGGKYFGQCNGKDYEIKDDSAEYFYNAWQIFAKNELAREILRDENLWECDLTSLPGFAGAVQEQLNSLMEKGCQATVKELLSKKELA